MNELAVPRILIVDDEVNVAALMKEIIQDAGYIVPEICRSGEDAVKKATELKPDLILMDILLGGDLDGVAAAEQIRSQLNIPVVYVSVPAELKQVVEPGLAAVGPMLDVMAFEVACAVAAGEATLRVAHLERAAKPRGQTARLPADIEYAAVGVVRHRHDAGITDESPHGVGGECRTILERGAPIEIGIGEHLAIHVHHDQGALGAGGAPEAARQRALGKKRKGIRLALARREGGCHLRRHARFRGSVG